jgi:hypothetical protein
MKMRLFGVFLIWLASACGSAPSLTLVGPSGPIAGVRLSACAKGLFSSSCADTVPDAAPATVLLHGSGGVELRLDTNAPNGAFVRTEHGSWDRKGIGTFDRWPPGTTVHLDPSADVYFVTVSVDSGSGVSTYVFAMKVDPAP